jgi:hypothetical protein
VREDLQKFRFSIAFHEVEKVTGFKCRVVNPRKVNKLAKMGYEVVTTPIHVRTGRDEYSYLMEIPEQKHEEGQEVKQLDNDLRTYDVTGEIGKNLQKFTKPREKRAAKEALDETPVTTFLKDRLKKKFKK